MFLRYHVDKSTFLVCRYQRQILLPQRQDELETMEAEAGYHMHMKSLNILCNEYKGYIVKVIF